LGRLAWLLMVFLLPRYVEAKADVVEQTFPLLQTKTGMYTNVTVTKKTDEWVFIMHSTGVCNVNVSDLSPEMRTSLGYSATIEKTSKSRSSGQPFAKLSHLKIFQN